LGLLFTALACCVFLWGLEYKLSLYFPPQAASHHVPMAKLLSKSEQSNTEEITAYSEPNSAIKALLTPSSPLPFILLLVCAFGVPMASFLDAVIQPPIELRQALRETFFVRPPPLPNA
jgi:hypothetical protein